MVLLKDSSDYLNFVVEQANVKFPNENFNQENLPYNDCTLVYVISSTNPNDIKAILPYFSKVNLLHHVNLIKRLGIKVALFKIPVNGEANETDEGEEE
ncbi:hypothetical protein C173_20521 [Paenibacillus sp. FSL R7-277]|nr:hypothetical protein C173_20521 [Paenibacillus sp. FSL R7-277]